MLAQLDAVDEIEVGIHYLAWLVTAEHPDEQSHYPLDQNGIGITLVGNRAVIVHPAREPYAALTAVNEVLLRAAILRKSGQ